jgi:hypothetical protein
MVLPLMILGYWDIEIWNMEYWKWNIGNGILTMEY